SRSQDLIQRLTMFDECGEHRNPARLAGNCVDSEERAIAVDADLFAGFRPYATGCQLPDVILRGRPTRRLHGRQLHLRRILRADGIDGIRCIVHAPSGKKRNLKVKRWMIKMLFFAESLAWVRAEN